MIPRTLKNHIRIVRLTEALAESSKDPSIPPILRLNVPTAFPLLLESAAALADEVERLQGMVAGAKPFEGPERTIANFETEADRG